MVGNTWKATKVRSHPLESVGAIGCKVVGGGDTGMAVGCSSTMIFNRLGFLVGGNVGLVGGLTVGEAVGICVGTTKRGTSAGGHSGDFVSLPSTCCMLFPVDTAPDVVIESGSSTAQVVEAGKEGHCVVCTFQPHLGPSRISRTGQGNMSSVFSECMIMPCFTTLIVSVSLLAAPVLS